MTSNVTDWKVRIRSTSVVEPQHYLNYPPKQPYTFSRLFSRWTWTWRRIWGPTRGAPEWSPSRRGSSSSPSPAPIPRGRQSRSLSDLFSLNLAPKHEKTVSGGDSRGVLFRRRLGLQVEAPLRHLHLLRDQHRQPREVREHQGVNSFPSSSHFGQSISWGVYL